MARTKTKTTATGASVAPTGLWESRVDDPMLRELRDHEQKLQAFVAEREQQIAEAQERAHEAELTALEATINASLGKGSTRDEKTARADHAATKAELERLMAERDAATRQLDALRGQIDQAALAVATREVARIRTDEYEPALRAFADALQIAREAFRRATAAGDRLREFRDVDCPAVLHLPTPDGERLSSSYAAIVSADRGTLADVFRHDGALDRLLRELRGHGVI